MTRQLDRQAAQRSPAAPRTEPVDDLALAMLLSSRICHDLISPVGALNNGVEIIEGGADPEFREHAMRVIAQGARQSKARLEFYRAAFGAGGADESQLDEVRDLVRNFLEGGRMTLEWESGAQILERGLIKLFLNLILIGVEALPRGGVLRAGVVRAAATNLIVIGEGRSTRFDERARSLLRDGALAPGESAPQPREAPMLLAHRLARAAGADLSFGEEDGRVVLAATV